MSRVGYAPISVPGGVDVTIDGSEVTVKGPKGTLNRTFADQIGFALEDGVLTVTRSDDERDSKALHGLSRALLANMVEGVSAGFTRELQTVGVGYRASLQGKTLELQVGYSHPVRMEAPDGIDFEVPDPTRIIVSGIDKQQVGQVAADIRAVRPPEPYKGKGIRYSDEYVRRKAGKAGVATA
jgi:large subunit ribosomal protein L6